MKGAGARRTEGRKEEEGGIEARGEEEEGWLMGRRQGGNP